MLSNWLFMVFYAQTVTLQTKRFGQRVLLFHVFCVLA